MLLQWKCSLYFQSAQLIGKKYVAFCKIALDFEKKFGSSFITDFQTQKLCRYFLFHKGAQIYKNVNIAEKQRYG